MIFLKVKFNSSDKPSKKSSENENIMLFRVSLIVATGIACWLPIIIFSVASFFGYPIPDIIHSLTSIVLLLVNSLLNPVIFSKVDVTLKSKLKLVLYLLKIFKNKHTKSGTKKHNFTT